MNSPSFDFLILGTGFGGSLLGLILARAGKAVAMVDHSRHPRFAIGESSTPLADRTLSQMAIRFRIPELRPLCHWGTWKDAYPHLTCGRKRGFTYFDQTMGEELTPENFSTRRLLVSASEHNESADTHWLRSDVDQFLFELAISSGVTAFQDCRYSLSRQDTGWTLKGMSEESTVEISACFLVDATGSNRGVLSHLNISDQTRTLRTCSRSIFAHFAHTKTCHELLNDAAIPTQSFPYVCDDAAVHQVLRDGWMWQLRFDDNTLSAGFMIDCRSAQAEGKDHNFGSAEEEWESRISACPFLQKQFARATIVRPETGLRRTGRIQRLAGSASGHDWAALPNTAGFIDPLHSTGIAHTLFGVARLAEILLSDRHLIHQRQRLADYSTTLIRELQCVDMFAEGCYEAIPSFRLWCLWSMLYFAAATSMEQQPDEGWETVSFLRAGDPEFREVLAVARQQLGATCRSGRLGKQGAEKQFADWLKSALEPWNRVGLFDEACDNLYSATAAPANTW